MNMFEFVSAANFVAVFCVVMMLASMFGCIIVAPEFFSAAQEGTSDVPALGDMRVFTVDPQYQIRHGVVLGGNEQPGFPVYFEDVYFEDVPTQQWQRDLVAGFLVQVEALLPGQDERKSGTCSVVVGPHGDVVLEQVCYLKKHQWGILVNSKDAYEAMIQPAPALCWDDAAGRGEVLGVVGGFDWIAELLGERFTHCLQVHLPHEPVKANTFRAKTDMTRWTGLNSLRTKLRKLVP